MPGGAYVQDDWGFLAVYGGNPELEPETGHTLGAGLIYTPVWAKGLSASVDYFQVNHSNQISGASPDECCSECAEHGSSLCEAITRLPDGRVSQLATTYRQLRGVGSPRLRLCDQLVGNDPDRRSEFEAARHLPRSLGQAAVSRRRGVFVRGQFRCGRPAALARVGTHRLALRAVDGQLRRRIYRQLLGTSSTPGPFGIDFDPFDRRVDPVLYHDIEAGFKFDSGVTVRAAITNVTDEDPPYLNIAPANTDVATYRLLGRSYFLELRYQVE